MKSPSVAVVGLTVLWVSFWGDLTIGNVLAGVAVALVVRRLSPLPGREGDPPRLDLLRLVRFVGFVVAELVVSSVAVVRVILSRQDRVRSGVVEVPLSTDSPALITIIGNVVTLTPGTISVEARQAPSRLAVHFLDLPGDDAAAQSVRKIERAVIRAFGPGRPADDEVVHP